MFISATRSALVWALLLATGCTPQYMAQTVRSGAAVAGITDRFQIQRAGNFRFVAGTRLYIAVAARRTGQAQRQSDLENALAHAVSDAFSGPFLTTLAHTAASREAARSAAAAAGSSLLVYPCVVDNGSEDAGSDTLLLRLEIFEVVTGRPVDRVVVRGRAAFENAALDDTALQVALTRLAYNLTGSGAPADQRLSDLL